MVCKGPFPYSTRKNDSQCSRLSTYEVQVQPLVRVSQVGKDSTLCLQNKKLVEIRLLHLGVILTPCFQVVCYFCFLDTPTTLYHWNLSFQPIYDVLLFRGVHLASVSNSLTEKHSECPQVRPGLFSFVT